MSSTDEPRAPRATPSRSGAIAAVLSFIFPGLGQAYLRHRRTALLFAVPVIALLFLLTVFAIRSGLIRAGLKLLDPSVALFGAVVVLLLGLWWIAAIVSAYRAGHRRQASALIVPVLLVFVIGSATVYGADWMWRLRSADLGLYHGQDPTIADVTLMPSPSASPSEIAIIITPGPDGTLASPTPVPPDWIDPTEQDPNDTPPPSLEPGPTPAIDITKVDAKDDGWLNVLLVGLDWQPGRTTQHTDTMIVVSANSATGQVYMFSFPRDTSQFPVYTGGTYPCCSKLNTFSRFTKDHPELFPNPGLPSLANEIGYLLGIPIDYYASINMPGFLAVFQQVGTVTVCNPVAIADDHMQFYLSAGWHTLSPDDALRYARSRHGSSDFARARRQQQLIVALRQEMVKPQNIARLPDIIQALNGVVTTDFPPDQIDQLVNIANQVQAQPTAQYVFQYPQWATHLPDSQTNGRSVQFLKLDKVAALSEQIFGSASLYNQDGLAPSVSPFDLGTPTPSPTDPTNPCQ